jgi:hypothetical protein
VCEIVIILWTNSAAERACVIKKGKIWAQLLQRVVADARTQRLGQISRAADTIKRWKFKFPKRALALIA